MTKFTIFKHFKLKPLKLNSNFKFQISNYKRVFLAVLFIGLLILGFLKLKNSRPAVAAWFNDSWLYRKAINIANSSGGDLTDFQVSFTIDTTDSTKFQTTCNDIRITDINGKLLPHWIEENNPGCNNAATKIWVKVPTLPTSGQTIYVYYGNPSAVNTASGEKVFELFEDFSKNTLDSSKWNSSGTVSISNGTIQQSNNGTIVSKNPVTTSTGLGQVLFRAKQALVNLSGGKIGLTSTTNTASDFSAADSVALSLGNTEEKLTDFGGANKVAQFKLEETTLTNGSPILDATSNHADMQVVTGATSATGKINKALTFNGSTQYLKQKIYANQTGASWGPTYHGLSMANGQAFARVQGVNLATYASASNDYMLVMKDGESDVAWGYINTADVTEGLGNELISNNTFADSTGWTKQDGSTPLTITSGEAVLSSATYAQTNISLTVGKLYKVVVDLYKSGTASFQFNTATGNYAVGQITYNTFSPANSKTTYTFYFTPTSAGSKILIYENNGTGGTLYMDNFYIKEVTDVGTDGVHIVSTKAGSTRNWAGISATFNYNYNAYTFEVRKTNFQITGAMTIGAWIKTNSLYWQPSITKGSDSSSPASYILRTQSDTSKYIFSINPTDATTGRQSSTTITTGTWFFVVGVYQPSTNLDIYINGLLDNGTLTASIPSSITDTSYPLSVGNYWGIKTNGTIDEPFVLSSALSADQIKALYEYYTLSTSHTATKTIPANTADGTNDTNYHVYQLTSGSTAATLSQDGTTLATSTTNLPTVSQYVRLQNTDTTNALSVDWIAVTKIASTTPTTTLATAEQSQGPVAYWKLDEGTGLTANDSTTNRNTGTLTNMSATPATNSGWITEDACVSGKCLGFDGINDLVTVANESRFDFENTNSFTISGWIKTNVTSTRQMIVTKMLNSGNYTGYSFEINSTNQLYVTIRNSVANALEVRTNSTLSPNTWYHLTMTYNGSKSPSGVKIYVNGVSWTTTTITDALTNSILNDTSVLIGVRGTTTAPFNGFIDEPKIYNYARSAIQVKTDFKARGTSEGVSANLGANKQNLPDSLSNGLVGYWRMDEATWSGTLNEVLDSSGNGNNGQAQGGTSHKPYPSSGKFGNGGYFDGVDDYVSATVPKSSEYTISAWIKLSRTGAEQFIANWTSTQFWVSNGNKLVYGGANLVGNTALSGNTWYHATVTRSSAQVRLYLNGAIDGSTTTSLGSAPSNDNFYFARFYGGGYFLNGYIDDLRIYNRALPPKEVRDLYNWAPGPKVYLKLEEGSGTSAQDSSGNSNTGTLNNGALWKTGKVGKGVWLEGTDDNVSVGDFGY